MRTKILLTGSCGFIVGNLTRKLVYLSNKEPQKYPYSIISIDKANKHSANSIYWNKNHIFHIADIRDQHIMDNIFRYEQPDIVIHGAAETEQDSNCNDFVSSNVLGTQVLLNCAYQHQVKRFIYLSSIGCYGDLLTENVKPPLEIDSTAPSNPYNASKLAGEILVQSAQKSFKIDSNIIRLSNNYGPRQNALKLIPKTIKSILHDQPITLYGSGAQIRDWIHVFDSCQAIVDILQNGSPNEIYNVSANLELSNLELVNKICNYMDKGHKLIQFINNPRISDDFRHAANSSKLKSLGWSPKIKFLEGLKENVNWFILNKWILT